MKKIYLFLLLFLFFIFFNSYAEVSKDLLQKRNKAASAIDELKMALSPEQKKISSLLRDKINQIKILKKSKSLGEIRNQINDKTINLDTQERLRIDIIFKKTISKAELENVIPYLEDMGCVKINKYWPENIDWMPEVICSAPYDHLEEISSLKIVFSIQPVIGPVTNSGSILTEGDSQLKADMARSTNNISGAGIRVGVVSDGIDSRGQSIGTGDLPTDIINVANEGGVEGTAMMEIIYDLAPQCSFSFASAGSSSNEMSSRIFQLIGQDGGNCRIIVDDIGWPGDPYFKDGKLAQDIANWVQYYDLIYISAAGNNAESMYTAKYDEYGDGNIKWHDFYYANNSSNIQNMFSLANNQKVEIILQWADNWEEPQADFDIYLYEYLESTSLGDGGKDVQGSSTENPPREILTFTNTNGAARNYVIQIKMNHLSPNTSFPKLKLLALNRTEGMESIKLQYTHSYNQPVKNQIFGHPAAEGVISVAAYDALDTNNVEYYSSRGPTYIDNTTDPVVERKTPVITATDNVLITGAGGFGYQDENGDWRFPGTSAAAPHIAGIAALYKEKYPGSSHQEFYNDLTSNAVDIMGKNGGTWNEISGFGKADAYEALGGGPLKVTVDQQNSTGSSIGNIKHWESQWITYPVPKDFYWDDGSTQTLEADTIIIANGKYHDWKNKNLFKINENFNIDKNTNKIISQFTGISSGVIKNDLSGSSGGKIFFTDPWLRDTTITLYGKRNRGLDAIPHEYDSPLNLTLDSQHQGVFLDQSGPNQNWEPPYYSVKADAQQTFTAHGQNITGYFLNWEGTEVDFRSPNSTETPLVFHDDNAEAKAVYKGHLASNLSRATGFNNGRRVVVDSQGKYKMVYEDDGEIWYTYSTNEGATWHKEVRLSNGSGNNSDPSIAIGSFNHYHVVWYEHSASGGHIRYRQEGNSYIATLGTSSLQSVHPVITTNMILNFVMAVWNDGTKLKFKVYTDEGEWSSLESVPNTGAGCLYPTLANDGGSGYATHLAWQKNNQIYYVNMLYYVDEDYSFRWRYYRRVSDIGSLSENGYPSIAVRKNDNKPVLVWQARDNGQEADKLIVYRKKTSTSNSNWGAISEFYPGDYEVNEQPAVTTFLNTDYNDATIVWYGNGYSVLKVNKVNGSWSPVTTLSDYSRYPNISVYANYISNPPSYDNLIVYRKYNSAPYLIKNAACGTGGLNKSSTNSLAEQRGEEFPLRLFSEKKGDSTAYGSFLFTLKGPALTFPQINDTLLTRPFFRSNLMDPTGKMKFSYTLRAEEMNIKALEKDSKSFASDLLTIVLKEAGTDKTLDRLQSISLQNLLNMAKSKEDSLQETLSVDLSSYKVSGVYLDVLAHIMQQETYLPKRIVCYRGQTDLSIAKEGHAEQDQVKLPDTFKLYENYPNPFNPTTHITVDLPREANVHLTVYNVKGQKVKELMNGYKDAGTYEVIFDGSGLASGVYIYRLTTNNGYSCSRKMMLIR